MVSASLYIGVDVSTTAAKALIIKADDAKYTVIARSQHAFKPLQAHADHPGRAEQVMQCHLTHPPMSTLKRPSALDYLTYF
jgi:sugar (pentulose or hexulose) kinase